MSSRPFQEVTCDKLMYNNLVIMNRQCENLDNAYQYC